MHGNFGEDGTIQGMLELTGVKYTGSRVLASSIGMDKDIFRKIMIAEKLPIPKYLTVTKNYNIHKIIDKMGVFPYFVKPVNGGSSVGASIANNLTELKKDWMRHLNMIIKFSLMSILMVSRLPVHLLEMITLRRYLL